MRGIAALRLAVVPLVVWGGEAQAARYPLNLAGATFVERVHSDVTTQSGTAELHRTILRLARYSTTTRIDTLVVTADSLDLDETVDNRHRPVDVDAVIGGRWKLVADGLRKTTVVDAPFVPGEVADVSDLGSAMDDFFPMAPPALAPGAQSTDSLPRVWRRLADSASAQRYHWSERRHADSTSIGTDSIIVHAVVDTREEGDLAWSATRGPLAWMRRIQTMVTSRFAGRTVRANVDQRIVVARTR
ncbi:MAG TPA: hypothetical protein VID74_00895 [Gemmatimonadales bacterium]